jgi:energy-coupling factor transporter ATP-binding protein EcfA2
LEWLGRMGQGKSRLLQSLTGLSDEVIPTGSQGVCTSTMTKIFHQPGSIKAEINFYTWDLFRDAEVRN